MPGLRNVCCCGASLAVPANMHKNVKICSTPTLLTARYVAHNVLTISFSKTQYVIRNVIYRNVAGMIITALTTIATRTARRRG